MATVKTSIGCINIIAKREIKDVKDLWYSYLNNILHSNTDTPVLYLLVRISKNSQIRYSDMLTEQNLHRRRQMLLLDTILLSGPPIGEHCITLTCHRCHTIERFVKVF